MRDRSDKLLALCLFATLFSVYLLTFSGVYHSSDEMSMLVATDSLARRGAWDIELLRWMGEQQGSFGPDGHLYSRKGIGTTLAALPHYWLALQFESLGNVQVAMLTNAVITALTAVLIFGYVRLLKYGRGASLGTGLAYGLATMAWPYARYLFSEPLAGLGLMFSAYFLLAYSVSSRTPMDGVGDNEPGSTTAVKPAPGASGRQWVYPYLAGVGLGLALLSRLNNAIVAPLLGLLLFVYLYRHHGRNWRRWTGPVLLFVVPVVAALLIAGWYNLIRFGNPLITGYLSEERFATPFLEGLYGLTFSPGKGLFWYNPILLGALVAWPAFFRGDGGRHRSEVVFVAVVVLANLAFYAPWYLWWAGHGWGPRFLVAILPFAVLPLAPAFEAVRGSRLVAAGLGLLLFISVSVQVLAVTVDFNLYLEDVYATLGLYHSATLFDPGFSPLWRQVGYLRFDNLDLAWAREGSVEWAGLLIGSCLVVLSVLSLWAAWRKRFALWMGLGLLVLLGLGTVLSLVRYAPSGDVARAAHILTALERTNGTAVLTDPVLTEAFQNAYDGRMGLWGVGAKEDLIGDSAAIWVVGDGEPEPTVARFQVGDVRLDHYLAAGRRFEVARLPVPRWDREARLDGVAKLVAIQVGETELRRGESLPVVLYWRALGQADTSYTSYVQLIDETGAKAGQVDRLPCDGGCLTTTWRLDDLIGEWYDLPVDPDAPPGSYRLIVGMYDFETDENLTWLDAQGNVIGPNLVIGLVEIER